MQILTNVAISDYPSGVRYVMDKARTQIRSPVYDPAGYGGNVASYLDTYQKVSEVVNRLETAYTRAVDAEELARRGRVEQAFDKWRMIFSDYFPAYS